MKTINTTIAQAAIFFIWFFLVIPSKIQAQNQPSLLDLRDCGNSCSSNNFTIKQVYLSDASGVPLSSSFATCTPGVQQTAYISIVYNSNSGSSTSNTRLFADLSIGGTSQFINIWLGNLPSAKSGDKVVTLNHSFTWTCGAQVRLLNPLLAWTTSGSANLSSSYQCNDYPSAQCQFGADITVDAPLAVQFDYTACTQNGLTSVKFISTTNGGSLPYVYNWTFGPNASPSTSTLADPTVTFSSNGTATLVVTDSKGVTNTFTKTVTLPSELAISSSVSQPSPGTNNGSISLTVNGGTGTKTVTWNDGTTGLNRTNLPAGTYIATVTDEFNCQKSETFILSSPIPNISLIKSGVYEDTNGDGVQNVGDRINYTFLVTNIGNFPLSNVTVSDPSISLTGSSFSLPVGSSNDSGFSGFYILKQSDIEAGFFTNSASVSASAGNINVSASDSHTETLIQSPNLLVTKIQIGGPNPVTAAGQKIDYEITVTNTGNINISNLTILDFLPGSSSGITLTSPDGDLSDPGVLNVGETWVYNISYIVAQEVFDLGDNLVNVVNVTTNQVPGPVVASAITPVTISPALSISKTATESTFDAVGDVLNYTIIVTNTGNVTLSNIAVSDPLTGLNTTISTLAPLASESIPTSYTITQSDIDAGKVDNTASAAVGAVNVSASESVAATQSPAVSITKTATENTFDAVGDVLNYTIVVTNTGNVTLSNIAVSDPLTGLNTTIATLAPLASQSIPTSYTIKQSDIDAGKVDNTASAAVGSVNVSASESVSATQVLPFPSPKQQLSQPLTLSEMY
jgi:uncharacterized repeat protein (TIGR01451 family)